MQETLSQLSELNNEAIVESSRTARTLTDEHFGGGEVNGNGRGVDGEGEEVK